jgi:hypothetical protein
MGAGQTAPPEVWVVAAGLVVIGLLLVLPFLQHGFTLLGHLGDSNAFERSLSALVLFVLVLVAGVGAALMALAVGVVRGSRVAQFLTGLLSGIVGVGELIQAANDHRSAFGSPGVSHGAEIAVILVCTVIIVLLFALPNGKAFFAQDDRPVGVLLGTTVAVYFGAVMVLDGMLLMICGSAGAKYVWWGLVLAVAGSLLMAASRPLKAGTNLARVLVTVALVACSVLLFVVDNAGQGASLSVITLVPLGLCGAAVVGLWYPASSNEHFAHPTTLPARSGVFTAAWSVLAVLALVLAGTGFSAASKSGRSSAFYDLSGGSSQYTDNSGSNGYSGNSSNNGSTDNQTDTNQTDDTSTDTPTDESTPSDTSTDTPTDTSTDGTFSGSTQSYTGPGVVTVEGPQNWTEDDSAGVTSIRDYDDPSSSSRLEGAYFRIGIGNAHPSGAFADEAQQAADFLVSTFSATIDNGPSETTFMDGTDAYDIEYEYTPSGSTDSRHGIERLFRYNGATLIIQASDVSENWTSTNALFEQLVGSASVS